jgi:hypothetical protein
LVNVTSHHSLTINTLNVLVAHVLMLKPVKQIFRLFPFFLFKFLNTIFLFFLIFLYLLLLSIIRTSICPFNCLYVPILFYLIYSRQDNLLLKAKKHQICSTKMSTKQSAKTKKTHQHLF